VKGSAVSESVRNGGFLRVIGKITFGSLFNMSVNYSVLLSLTTADVSLN